MAIIASFRGVRFNPEKINNLEEVVTPPYDVISEQDGEAFLQKNQYNMIQLDLRNNSQTGEGSNERYAEAARRFAAWQDEGILIREDVPSIYLYYTEYKHPSGRRLIRKGLVSLVGLAEFSEGIVKPHEKTFDGVVAERLELMETCQAQFSKIFSIYSDPTNSIISMLEEAREPDALCSTSDHMGNTHTLWRVSNQEVLSKVSEMFSEKSLYIADGHHRYTTALHCRRRALEKNPDLPADSPYRHIMMYLCPIEDEGLSILPTHRLVNFPEKISGDEFVAKMNSAFKVEELTGGSREVLTGEVLARMNESSMNNPEQISLGLYLPGEDRCFLLTLLEDGFRGDQFSSNAEVLQQLDVVVLSDLVIKEILALDSKRCIDEKIVSYSSDPDEALDIAVKMSVAEEKSTPVLFLLNPTRAAQVMEVADQDNIMPHKSTYFYPKIVTGLLINKLGNGEKV
ncbi:MAG: DUF1015 domain-containing protein [Desulfobulbaceae bacterium]|nr:DUF1015 domain-containing protein [Desulfobulbaceae bacterium]